MLSKDELAEGIYFVLKLPDARRKSNRIREALDWALHVVGLPFFYVYELMRNRPSEASYAPAPKPPEAEQAMTREKQQ